VWKGYVKLYGKKITEFIYVSSIAVFDVSKEILVYIVIVTVHKFEVNMVQRN